MRRWMVIAACALVGSVALYLTLFRSSDEDEIKKTLARLVKTVMVKEPSAGEQGDNIISRTARLKSELSEIVDDDVRIDVPDLHIATTGRKEVVEKAARAGVMFSSADCELTNQRIQIDEGATTAKVDAVAIFTGVRGGDRRIDRRDVHFLLRKDGRWRVTTIDVRAPD